MNSKINNLILIFSVLLIISSCGLLKESNGVVNYKTTDFNSNKAPKSPTYESLDDWLVHPEKNQLKYPYLSENNNLLKADVFFVVPTLFSDKRNTSWNSNIYDNQFSELLIESSIKYQATAWVYAGNLYSPIYRQAHFRVFDERFL